MRVKPPRAAADARESSYSYHARHAVVGTMTRVDKRIQTVTEASCPPVITALVSSPLALKQSHMRPDSKLARMRLVRYDARRRTLHEEAIL